STDNVGVAGYKIFRGGTQVGTSATTTFMDSGLSASTQYSYTVAAYDAAGNVSANSVAASATTAAVTVAPGVPTTYNTGHPRLPVPDQAYLLRLAANATEFQKYNAVADALDPKNPTPFPEQFRRALIAYMANKAAGNTTAATTYLNKFKQLADLGGTWGE